MRARDFAPSPTAWLSARESSLYLALAWERRLPAVPGRTLGVPRRESDRLRRRAGGGDRKGSTELPMESVGDGKPRNQNWVVWAPSWVIQSPAAPLRGKQVGGEIIFPEKKHILAKMTGKTNVGQDQHEKMRQECTKIKKFCKITCILGSCFLSLKKNPKQHSPSWPRLWRPWAHYLGEFGNPCWGKEGCLDKHPDPTVMAKGHLANTATPQPLAPSARWTRRLHWRSNAGTLDGFDAARKRPHRRAGGQTGHWRRHCGSRGGSRAATQTGPPSLPGCPSGRQAAGAQQRPPPVGEAVGDHKRKLDTGRVCLL